MDSQPPKFRRWFLKSPHHAGLALATLGAGFMTGEPLYLLIGGAAYILGWIYLPDMPLFRRWVERRRDAERSVAAQTEVAEFVKRRDAFLEQLSTARRSRYHTLSAVCRDIEVASADNSLSPNDPANDPRLRKLDELMWTFLRMLTIEEALDRFLETERREEVPRLLQEAEEEVAQLTADFEALKRKAANTASLDAKERLLGSRLERLEVLRKRLQRIEQAQANHALVISEQERLDQQIKLIRADAIASKNAETLAARIDATVEHLDQTNKWLAEMDEFRDLVGDIPSVPMRVGYASGKPPVIPQSEQQAAGVQSDRRSLKVKERK